ncbi:MAG: hypothetical protein DRN29_09115 [Thermoplasmata archaeon]|nr:MAG: hypothetical protein DRN29_09115 [Thermoplasmata archaeon]
MGGVYMDLFLSMLLLVFAIGTILAGLFTIYFGSGRSRAIGGVLFIIGIIVALVFYNYSGGELWGIAEWDWDTVKAGIASIIGGIIGALIALGVFLAGIMKA